MGHRHSRVESSQVSRSRPGASFESISRSDSANKAEPSTPSVKVKFPFRCEDRSKIPDELLEGPFDDFQIAEDVYATFYLLARNATPEMYSISPFRNPDVRIAWLYLLFIAGSQIFVIAAITVLYPPTVQQDSAFVNCQNLTAVSALHARGFLAAATTEACEATAEPAFEADVRGQTVMISQVNHATEFYHLVLASGNYVVLMLRLVCCSWVFSQVYLQEFSSVRALLRYHDFSRWFLPLKGEVVRNSWAICVPIVQYIVLMCVTTVSFLVICAFDEPFDIVMNSLAFTFIAEVGSFFNEPLVSRMAATSVQGLPADYDEIKYLYPEYRLSNAIREDGTYTDLGWYICDDEEKAGLLSDYRVRHNEAVYPQPHSRTAKMLEILIFVVPPVCVFVGALHSHCREGCNLASFVSLGNSEL
ncbi:unnamed protein product [Symbiodinium natans]|uniref:Transmembrane protein n=1 Tax=Symbiodinium natans TaxID=878477 RepID=A0A812RAF1_9DINO|nr:unnamed protein product [Symbiodinium natans]